MKHVPTLRHKLVTSSSLLPVALAFIGFVPSVAHAQSGDASATGVPGNTDQSQAADPTPVGDESAQLPEADEGQNEAIFVTAQRRSEDLQRVPIAITAVTANTVEQLGIGGTLGLQIAAPALTLTATPGGAAAVTMRGVVGTGSNGDEAPTSVYVDGLYLSGTPGLYFDLNNIERIEVLKGPQGTLFGRNSVGGSIQIITRTPEFTPQFIGSVEYANFNRVSGQFYGTTGISDTVAVDLAVLYSKQFDGWGTNIFTGSDIYKDEQLALRSKILWQPGPDTEVIASGAYSRVETATLQGRAISEGRRNFAGLSDIGFYNTDENIDGYGYTTQITGSLKIDHDFGPVTFVSISGYEDTVGTIYGDFDSSRVAAQNIYADSPTKSYSQELQLQSSNSSNLEWLVGVFYFNSSQGTDQIASAQDPLANPSVFSTVNARSPIDSYSAFAQATLEVFPGTKLTGGLRYTLDERSIRGFTGNQNGQTPINERSRSDDGITYRVAIAQQITDEVMAYGSVSTGFKSGTFAITAPNGAPTTPSFLDAYELGFKADLLENTLRLNVSAFWNDFTDVQVRIRLPDNSGNIFTNASTVEAKGVEADLTYRASNNLSFRGGLSYLDSKYIDYQNATCFFPRPTGIGNITQPCDASGMVTMWSPELVFTLSANYGFDTSIGRVTFSATESHNSGFFLDPQNRVSSGDYDLVNLSVEWRSLDDVFSVRGWMRNALDQQYYGGAQISGFGDLMYVTAPRTFGVTLKASY